MMTKREVLVFKKTEEIRHYYCSLSMLSMQTYFTQMPVLFWTFCLSFVRLTTKLTIATLAQPCALQDASNWICRIGGWL